MADLKVIENTPSLVTPVLKDESGTGVIDLTKIGVGDRYLRKQEFQYDTTGYSTTTAWAKASTFPILSDFKAGSLIFIYFNIPMRNESSTWGGAYIEPQVNINNTGWKSLGSSGYRAVMGYGGRIMSYTNFMLLDLEQTSDFSLQFQFYFRAYDGTALWRNNRNIGKVSGTATKWASADHSFYPSIHIKEYALLV